MLNFRIVLVSLLCLWPLCLSAGEVLPTLEERVQRLEEASKKPAETGSLLQDHNPVHIGAFVDTYYAFDFKEPASMDRVFTTQPSRHNEFNINLAYIEAKIEAPNYRGRLALQAGTSVEANYAAERKDWAKYIQEAYAGFSPYENLWIDAGIYFSHIGLESFISRDNWTYTRSLPAEFSPYYQTGVRVSYAWCRAFSTQLHLINGWQNISETNAAKAIGMQMAFTPNAHLSLTYNNFLGKEAGERFRHFHDFVAKVAFEPLEVAAVYDLGVQERDPFPGTATWHALALLARYQLHPRVAIAGRGERFIDREQTIVTTNTPRGFQTWGASGNLDISLVKNLLWRNEYRHFWSADAVYPNKSSGSKQDHFFVSSLTLSF